jgi:hypothetical protein
MANVFLVSPRLGPEDRLTAYWHYVLDVLPGIGQAFVDHVSARSGLHKSRFLGTVDHPFGNRASRPDFLIRCRDYDLLFEHKLDSPLGPGQLERYLAVARDERKRLALIAGRRLEVGETVRRSRWFIHPRDNGAPPHFLWQDVHRIVGRFRARIARDFRKYLENLGLAKFDWGGLGDPFTREEAARELRSLYGALVPMFRGPGVSCIMGPNSLVYQIRKPFPQVHLLNVLPVASVAEWDPRVWGRVMALNVWVRRTGGRDRRLLPTAHGYIRGSSPRIFVDDDVSAASYDHTVFLERQYYVALHEVLVRSKSLSQSRLVSFVQTAVDHLKGRRALVCQDDA